MKRRTLLGVGAAGLAVTALLGGAVLVAPACVPADDRPPPGSLTVTVSPSPAVQNGVTTADGWTIAFPRVLVAMGNASLDDGCVSYGEANYDRVLDVTSGAGQKLGILHGLGQCDLRFRVAPPSSDALLGAGVTEADKTAMRTPGDDAYVPLGGIAVDVLATATRGADAKRLHLLFRPSLRYQHCTLGGGDADAAAVNLESNVDLAYDVRIEAESLLRDDVDAAAPLRFDPFAAADTNGDGDVTLDELRAVPLARVRDGGAFEAGTYEVDDAGVLRSGTPVTIATLGDYVYLVLMPTFPRFRGTGACTPTVRDARR